MLGIDAISYEPSDEIAVVRKLAKPLINLSSGVNFHPPPAPLLEHLSRAIRQPVFHLDYDGYQGHLLARRAICLYENLVNKSGNVTEQEILITCGAGAAMHLLGLYLGDRFSNGEVLIPVPTFPLAGAALAAGGLQIKEVHHRDTDRFLPNLEEYEAAITICTRVLYLNMFNNPTGEYYSRSELRQIVAWAKDTQILLLIDRVSADIAPPNDMPNVLEVASDEGYLDGLILLCSLSKERSLPGLRVGWLRASSAIVRKLVERNSIITMSSPTLSAAVIFIDMLARSTVLRSRARPAMADAESMTQQATTFWNSAAELIELAPDLVRFLEPVVDPASLANLFAAYSQWDSSLRQLLSRNWRILSDGYPWLCAPRLPWQGDFNTFVRIPGLDGCDPHRATIALFFAMGLQILPGPAFGWTAAEWTSGLGFWARLSFALESDVWQSGLERLATFVGKD